MMSAVNRNWVSQVDLKDEEMKQNSISRNSLHSETVFEKREQLNHLRSVFHVHPTQENKHENPEQNETGLW